MEKHRKIGRYRRGVIRGKGSIQESLNRWRSSENFKEIIELV